MRFLLSFNFLALVLMSTSSYAQTTVIERRVVETTPVTTQVVETQTPVTVERRVIETPVPAAKEVVTIPAGYADCFTVKAGWYRGVWVPERQVCEYQNSKSGVAWIEGYWACMKYKDGTCIDWEWKSGHWSKQLEIY